MDELAKGLSSLGLENEPSGQDQSAVSEDILEQRYSSQEVSLGDDHDEDEADDDDDDDDDDNDDDNKPLNEFEQSNKRLLEIFPRDCCIIKGPKRCWKAPSKRPIEFTRVCDNKTFVKFHEDVGFVNELRDKDDRLDLPAWPFINVEALVSHMSFMGRSKGDFRAQGDTLSALYISFCGSRDKLDREVGWRQRSKRENIKVYDVDASGMSDAMLSVEGHGSVRCLHERRWGTVYDAQSKKLIRRLIDIIFVNAKELIDKLKVREDILDQAYGTCSDEWLAIQRVPPEMIKRRTEYG